MEVHIFKMRDSQDNRVRESFAPEFHLRQNSNSITYVNEDGNHSGLNDDITSARFNYSDGNVDQQNIENDQSKNIICNNSTPQSLQRFKQSNQQLKYLRRNMELQGYSSNGKQNLNSNGNYNTQRTNHSNQTQSEQFTNTVVKDRQVSEYVAYDEEQYEDEINYNQPYNNIQKNEQQDHYNQILMNQQYQKQPSKQNNQYNMNQFNFSNSQKCQSHNIQKQQKEHDYSLKAIQEVQYQIENNSGIATQDEKNNLSNSSIVKNGTIQQRNYENQIFQQQQQQIQQVNKKYNNNGDNLCQQELCELEDYNITDSQNDKCLNNLQQQFQQQSKYQQKILQQHLNKQKSSQQSCTQVEKQQIDQGRIDYNIQYYQENDINSKQYCNKRGLQQQNQYNDENQDTLAISSEEQEDQIIFDDNMKQKQYELNTQQKFFNSKQVNQNGQELRLQNSQIKSSPRYKQKNIQIQQIDKHIIDEHSNNTSNNEEGIVNISSIKKKIHTNMNTPVQSSQSSKISHIPMRENSNSQNTQSNYENQNKQSHKSEIYKDSISQNMKNSQNQARKNNFYENKENQYPYASSSLNRIQRQYSLNKSQTKGANSSTNTSPGINAHEGNKYLNNSHQFEQQLNKTQINKSIQDISHSNKIKDLSYSVFVEGNKYFEEDVKSKNTSQIQKQQQSQSNQRNKHTLTVQNTNQINQNQNNIDLTNPDNKFYEEFENNYTILNLQEDDYFDDEDQILNNDYLNENYHLQKSQQQFTNSQNNQEKQINSNNAKVVNNQNFNTIFQQKKESMASSEISNLQKDTKNNKKATNTTQSTQSTSITFQTQGFQRDSLGNKEIISNLNNIVSDGNIITTQKNEYKISMGKDEKQNTDSDLEQIELEQMLQNESDYKDQNEYIEKEDLNNNKCEKNNNLKGHVKQISSRNSSNDDEVRTNNKSANISRQLFQPNKEEFNDIYNLLKHERNKNNSLEEKLCSKQQLILNFQKTMEKITKENEQLKSDIDGKNKKIITLEKDIQKLRINQNSELCENLKLEKERFQLYQDKINNENQTLVSEKEKYQHQNQQLQEQNMKLENELKKLNQNNQYLMNEYKQKNILLTKQIEDTTSKKDEEIENLKKQLLKYSSQDHAYRKKEISQTESSLSNIQQQQVKRQPAEKGSLNDSMNTSSTAINTSMNQSFYGQPPRKNNIPLSQSQYVQKDQQDTTNQKKIANDLIKNQSNNYYSIPSSNEVSMQSQNYRKGRSSSVSYQDTEQQSISNQFNNITDINTVSPIQQPNHQYSFSHNNNFYQHDNSQNTSPIQQNVDKKQINFSITELKKMLNVKSDSEIMKKIKELHDQNKNTQQFVNCILDMVQKCDPSEFFTNKKPDLKQSWTILKQIMNKYLQLKMKIVRDNIDSDIIHKVQSYLQVSDKEIIIDRITNLQQENQKLTRIITQVKKNFNLEWTKSLYEFEKAIEIENSSFNKLNIQKQNRINEDNQQQPQQIKLNEKEQKQQQYYANTNQNRGQDIQQPKPKNQQNSSYSPHMRGHSQMVISPIQTNDYHLFQGQQIQNIHGLTTSSKRTNSANLNNNINHNLLI